MQWLYIVSREIYGSKKAPNEIKKSKGLDLHSRASNRQKWVLNKDILQ